jgi:hypothetical protein
VPTDLGALANQIATQVGIPPNILAGVVQNESGATGAGGPIDPSTWNPNAVSSAGAQGLGQLMPGTAAGLGVTNPFDPTQNLTGAATYLKQLYNQFGNWTNALQAYNAGPGAFQKDPTVSAGYAANVLKSAGAVTGTNPGTQPAGATGTNSQTAAATSAGTPAATSGSALGTGVKYGLFILAIILLVIFGIYGTVKS